jgi:epsilon-lactone hydrolase
VWLSSLATKAEADSLLDRASLDCLSSLYVAGQDRRNPLLSPAVTADLTGLPPMLVQFGRLLSRRRGWRWR